VGEVAAYAGAMTPSTILGRQAGAIVGRDNQVRLITGLIQSYELVTLTGLGGIGKTTLAAEIAHEVEPDFERIVVVELANESDDRSLHRAVATTLGLELPLEYDEVIDAVVSRSTLVVLDNCEHLLASVQQFCDAVVERRAPVSLLATSRRPLGRQYEALFDVQPLEVPSPDMAGTDDGAVEATTSVQLFVESVRRTLPAFELTSQNRTAVAEICALANGIPLMLELAAALVRTRPLEQISAALGEHQTAPPVRPAAGLPDRHESLAASVDWSLRFLDEDAQRLLGRLAVFVGGFSTEDAQAVDLDLSMTRTIEVLDALVDHSLVRLEVEAQRYRLLDIIRHTVLNKLTPDERTKAEAAATGRSLRISARIAQEQYEPDPIGRFDRFRADLQNLVQTAQRFEEHGDADGMKMLIGPIATWWVHHVPIESGAWWTRNFGVDLAADGPAKSAEELGGADNWQGNTWTAASVWCSHRGNNEVALRLAIEAVERSRSTGDTHQALIASIVVSNALVTLGKTDAALDRLHDVVAESAASELAYAELIARLNIVRIAPDEPRAEHLERALVISRLGFPAAEGTIYAELGLLALRDGNHELAIHHGEDGLRRARRYGYGEAIGSALCALAEIKLEAGANDEADGLFLEALEIAESTYHDGLRERATTGLASLVEPSDPDVTKAGPDAHGIEPLSDRELSVARLLRGDLTQREIGEELYIAPSTVKTHVKSIYRKLGVSKRSHAVTVAAELGLFG